MKEFEKYWERLEESGDLDFIENVEKLGGIVWKAALVWVHSQMVGVSPCSEPQQICKNIEKELQDETV